MKVLDCGVVREMTEEEVREYEKWVAENPLPEDVAGCEEYEQALTQMGVDFSD